MSKTKILVVVFFIIFFSFYFNWVIIPVHHGYDYFIQFAADLINKKQRVPAIRSVFPKERFLFIQQLVYITGIALFALFVLAIQYSQLLNKLLITIARRVKGSWLSFGEALKGTDRTAKVVFGLTIFYLVFQSVWYMNHLPFIHDEAYTISNFVIPGPIVSVTFYPYPNNHILFSLFSYPFSFLPLKPEIAFRLPSLIAVVMTCLVLFRLLLLFFKGTIAALGVTMFAFMLPVMSYSIFARGYSFVFLFTCLSTFALMKTIEYSSIYHCALLILFSVMGLYTLPSYMYPFAAIFTVYFVYAIINQNVRTIKRAVISGLICGISTVILYFPVVITSGGWNKFIKVLYFGYEEYLPITRIIDFINSVYSFQFFENNFLVVLFFLFVVITALISVRKIKGQKVKLNDAIFFWICLSGLLIPAISFLVQRKMVAPRTHSYIAFFIVGFTFITTKTCVEHKWKHFAFTGVTVSIIIMNIAFANTSSLLKGEFYNDNTADIFAREMIKDPKHKDTCYTFDMFYGANIQLQYALVKRSLTLYQKQPGSPSSATFNFNNNYNWIITTKEQFNLSQYTLTNFYTPVLDRKDATLWKKKERFLILQISDETRN